MSELLFLHIQLIMFLKTFLHIAPLNFVNPLFTSLILNVFYIEIVYLNALRYEIPQT